MLVTVKGIYLVNFSSIANFSLRTFHFSLEDSIEIANLYKIHGGNGEKIILEMYKKYRLTNHQSSNPRHKQKIKDHVRSLLKRTHSTWVDKIPEFKSSTRQKQQLSTIVDVMGKSFISARGTSFNKGYQ